MYNMYLYIYMYYGSVIYIYISSTSCCFLETSGRASPILCREPVVVSITPKVTHGRGGAPAQGDPPQSFPEEVSESSKVAPEIWEENGWFPRDRIVSGLDSPLPFLFRKCCPATCLQTALWFAIWACILVEEPPKQGPTQGTPPHPTVIEVDRGATGFSSPIAPFGAIAGHKPKMWCNSQTCRN